MHVASSALLKIERRPICTSTYPLFSIFFPMTSGGWKCRAFMLRPWGFCFCILEQNPFESTFVSFHSSARKNEETPETDYHIRLDGSRFKKQRQQCEMMMFFRLDGVLIWFNFPFSTSHPTLDPSRSCWSSAIFGAASFVLQLAIFKTTSFCKSFHSPRD